MASISAVVFDMNDVLCRYDKTARVASLAKASGRGPAAIEAAIWGSGYEDLGDAGAMDADEYLNGFGQRIGYALSLEQWVAAMKAAIAPLPETLALAARVGRKATVAVLTNNNLLVARTIDAVFPELRAAFGESIFVSAQFGARKPDPEVYRRCAARMGVEPEMTMFVDDSPKNVAGADAAKLVGHCYVDPPTLALALQSHRLLISD